MQVQFNVQFNVQPSDTLCRSPLDHRIAILTNSGARQYIRAREVLKRLEYDVKGNHPTISWIAELQLHHFAVVYGLTGTPG
eukprot:1471570-Amphidinium_carterae.1